MLPFEFRHRRRSRAARRLVGGDPHAADVRDFFYGVECHDHLYRRTVRVGDYPARRIERVFGIDLRNDQRHVGVHAETTRIVYHQRSVSGYRAGELARHAAARRNEREVYSAEIVVMLQPLYRQFPSAEHAGLACTALRAEQQKFVHGEIVFFEDFQEFLSYRAACAYYRYFHKLRSLKFLRTFFS